MLVGDGGCCLLSVTHAAVAEDTLGGRAIWIHTLSFEEAVIRFGGGVHARRFPQHGIVNGVRDAALPRPMRTVS